MKERNCKTHKHKESKQYITKQPIGHQKNWRGYLKKEKPRDKWPLNHNDLKQCNVARAVLRDTFIATQPNLRKQDKSQINNLTLNLKQLEREEQANPKVSRSKNQIKIISDHK